MSSGEHDQVNYKAGYEMGPANPLPQNKAEQEIFNAQKAVDQKVEAFEELKAQVEREKKEVHDKWAQEGKLQPDEELDRAYSPPPAADPERANPDNPDNYFLPPEQGVDNHNDEHLVVKPPGEDEDEGLEGLAHLLLEGHRWAATSA